MDVKRAEVAFTATVNGGGTSVINLFWKFVESEYRAEFRDNKLLFDELFI